MEFSRQECWSGLSFLSPEDLPHPGIKPVSFMSPALAGGFFTPSATWETQLPIRVLWISPEYYKRKTIKNSNIWRLNNTLLNITRVNKHRELRDVLAGSGHGCRPRWRSVQMHFCFPGSPTASQVLDPAWPWGEACPSLALHQGPPGHPHNQGEKVREGKPHFGVSTGPSVTWTL